MCIIRLDINNHTSPQYVPDDIRVRAVIDPRLEGREVGVRHSFRDPDFTLKAVKDFSDEIVKLLEKAGANTGKVAGGALLRDLLDDIESLVKTQTVTKEMTIRWRFEKRRPDHPVVIFIDRTAQLRVAADAPWHFRLSTTFDADDLPALFKGVDTYGFRQGHSLEGDLTAENRAIYLLEDEWTDVTDRILLSADLLGLGRTLTGFFQRVRDIILDTIGTLSQGTPTKDQAIVEVTDALAAVADEVVGLADDAKASVQLHFYNCEIRCLTVEETKTALEKVENYLQLFRKLITEELEPFAETDLPGSDEVLDLHSQIVRDLEELRRKLRRVLEGAEAEEIQ